MKVKVNGVWYDSKVTPICIQVSEVEQKHIAEIDRKLSPEGKYGSFPNDTGLSVDQMLNYMDEGKETPDA